MSVLPENLVFVQDDGLSRMFRRLKKGMRIKSRIVLVLSPNRYVLRIQGYNLVMESHLSFNRLDEIWVEVQQVRPKLKVRLLDSMERFRLRAKLNLKTDIKI